MDSLVAVVGLGAMGTFYTNQILKMPLTFNLHVCDREDRFQSIQKQWASNEKVVVHKDFETMASDIMEIPASQLLIFVAVDSDSLSEIFHSVTEAFSLIPFNVWLILCSSSKRREQNLIPRSNTKLQFVGIHSMHGAKSLDQGMPRNLIFIPYGSEGKYDNPDDQDNDLKVYRKISHLLGYDWGRNVIIVDALQHDRHTSFTQSLIHIFTAIVMNSNEKVQNIHPFWKFSWDRMALNSNHVYQSLLDSNRDLVLEAFKEEIPKQFHTPLSAKFLNEYLLEDGDDQLEYDVLKENDKQWIEIPNFLEKNN